LFKINESSVQPGRVAWLNGARGVLQVPEDELSGSKDSVMRGLAPLIKVLDVVLQWGGHCFVGHLCPFLKGKVKMGRAEGKQRGRARMGESTHVRVLDLGIPGCPVSCKAEWERRPNSSKVKLLGAGMKVLWIAASLTSLNAL